MPQEEGGLKGLYYKVTDKAWAFAEWLEAKGLPLSSFCDKHHINPLLILLVIMLGVIVLALMAFGTGVAYGSLAVTVTSNNNPVDGATVSYSFAGETFSNTTNALGKTMLKFPIGVETTVLAKKDSYKEVSATKLLDKDSGSLSISLVRKVGSLKVNINVEGDANLPSGAFVTVTGKDVSVQKNIVGGSLTFENLPAGVEVTAKAVVGSQNIPADQKATIQEGKTAEVTIEITENSLTTSVEVQVKDSSYQSVDGATVQLFGWDTGDEIGGLETTHDGSAIINNVPLGVSVYATVQSSGVQYGSYNGKDEGNKIPVSGEGTVYQVTIDIIGKVEICIYDESGAALMTGTAKVMGTNGQSYCTKSVASECVSCFGVTEGVSVYPYVTATGYQAHNGRADAQRVDYSTVASFDVDMQPLGEGQTVNVFAHVSDCDTGDPIDGIKVMIIDESSGNVLEEDNTECVYEGEMQHCGNIMAQVQRDRSIYAVAFDDEYQLARSELATATAGSVLNIETCEADDDNSGDLEVCVYKDSDPFEDAELELYDTDGYLLWTAETNEDEDDQDNCYTFTNIPDGQEVYAKATNLGGSSATSESATITAGEVTSLTVYKGSPPIELAEGDAEVCVKDKLTGQALIANVTIYDSVTDQKVAEGQTAAGGCKLFTDLVAERNDDGQVTPREIYIVASKTGYGTYNGKSEEDILAMVPDGKLTARVDLSEAFDICVQLKSSDTSVPMQGDVILYYTKNATAPIETKTTDLSGIARFSQAQKDTYYFKVEETYTLYDPMPLYTFPKADVSGVKCGVIRLYDLATLCTLGLEVLSDNVSAIKGQTASIPIRIFLDGEKGDESIVNEGALNTKHTVILYDGSSANVTLKIANVYKPFALAYGNVEYSSEPEILASFTPSTTGNFNALLEVTKNAQCSRQDSFPLKVYEENLLVSVDAVSFDPVMSNSMSFCIYATDHDGKSLKDAQVVMAVDEMDGWAQTATRNANYDEIKQCYKGALTANLVPKESGKYVAGEYLFSVAAKRGDITKIVQPNAKIMVTELCGNGKVDRGEQCDPENDTCQTGYSCSGECKCVQKQCGTLMVSADTATLSIGSGLGSGFCVRVEDDCGVAKDAQVSAKFYSSDGWAQDNTVNTGYDLARDCYYIPLSQNLVTTQVASNVNQMLGSKTVRIVATKGKNTGQTTTSVSITCGCDLDKHRCEATCPCDKVCLEGGGGTLNLGNCLILAGQQGAYPAGYTTPQYAMGGQMGYPSNMYAGAGGVGISGSGGGFNVGTGGIGITGAGGGGIGLNWDACKNLFGWGDGSSTGSDVKPYVLVKDYKGVIASSELNCKLVADHFKDSKELGGFKYFYVDKGGNNGPTSGEWCCTESIGKKECKWDTFSSLLKSNPSMATYVDVQVFTNTRQFVDDYGINDYKIIGEGKNTVLFAKDKLYGHGVVFGIYSKVKGGQGTDQLVWGVLDESILTNQAKFAQAFNEVWKTTSSTYASAKYLITATDKDKTIILADAIVQDTVSQSTQLKGAMLTTGNEDDFNPAWVGLLFRDTKLYVLTDAATMKGTSKLAQAAKLLAPSVPAFEEVTGDLKYCKDGTFFSNAFGGERPTLLNVGSGLYLIGTAGELVCDRDRSTQQVITENLPTSDIAKKVAFARESKGRTLLVSGRREDLKSFIAQFVNDPPKTGGIKIYYVPETGDAKNYGVIRAKCQEPAQKCTTTLLMDNLATAITQDLIDLPEYLPSDFNLHWRIIECICGDGKDLKGKLNLTIDFTGLKDYNNQPIESAKKSEMAVYLEYLGTKNTKTYPLAESEDDFELLIPPSGQASDTKIQVLLKNLDLKQGDLRVWATLIQANTACGSSDPRAGDATTSGTIPVSAFNNGVNTPKRTLTLTNKVCKTLDNSRSPYTITGTVVTSNNVPLKDVEVSVYATPSANGLPLGTPEKTRGDGTFKVQISGVSGTPVYAKGSYSGVEKTDPGGTTVAMAFLRLTGSASKNSGSVWDITDTPIGQEVAVGKLKFDNTILVALEGVLTDNASKTLPNFNAYLQGGNSQVSRRATRSRKGGSSMEGGITQDDGVFSAIGFLTNTGGMYSLGVFQKDGKQVMVCANARCTKETTGCTAVSITTKDGKVFVKDRNIDELPLADGYDNPYGDTSTVPTYLIGDFCIPGVKVDNAPTGGAVSCTLKSFTATPTGTPNEYNLNAIVNCAKGLTAWAAASDVTTFKFTIGTDNPPVTLTGPNNGDFVMELKTPVVRQAQAYVKIDIDGDGRDDQLSLAQGVQNPITIKPGGGAVGVVPGGGVGPSTSALYLKWETYEGESEVFIFKHSDDKPVGPANPYSSGGVKHTGYAYVSPNYDMDGKIFGYDIKGALDVTDDTYASYISLESPITLNSKWANDDGLKILKEFSISLQQYNAVAKNHANTADITGPQ